MENGQRELGEIQATLKGIEKAISELKGEVHAQTAQIATQNTEIRENHTAIADHKKQLERIWEWKDGMGKRVFGYIATSVGVAATVISALWWLFERTN